MNQKRVAIPVVVLLLLFNAANEPKQFLLIEGSGHNDWQTAEYFTALDSFIATQLSKEI